MVEILEIEDLRNDPRTASNPLVTAPPGMRFYAGVPLNTTDGHTLGTLCVIDMVPRPGGLTVAQRSGLVSLANQVMTQLALRRALAERDDAIVQQALGQVNEREQAACLEALIGSQGAVSAAGSDLNGMFTAIVQAALTIVGAADGAVVELVDGDCLIYSVVGGSLSSHAGRRVPLADTLSGRSLHKARPLICRDVELDNRIDAGLMRGLGIKSMIVVPVTWRGQPIAVLKVTSQQADVLLPRDLVMMQILAAQVGSAFGDASEASAARALRDAETRHRQTFESVTEFGIIVMDRGGIVTEWNTGAELIFGWSAEEMRGSDASRFYTADDKSIGRSGVEMHRALQDGSAVDERWHVRKDGSRFYASGNVMPLWGDRSEHLGFIKIVRDRTDQHLGSLRLAESQAALVASEAKWRGLFHDLHEGFIVGRVVRDANGTIVDWTYEEVNKAWGELFGIDSAMAVGNTIRTLFPGIDDAWVNDFADVVKTGQAVRFTRQLGTIGRWFDGVCQPADTDCFTVIFLEVTDRVLAERRREALRELDDDLLEASSPEEMPGMAARIVGTTLDVGRVGYGSMAADGVTVKIPGDWTRRDHPGAVGSYRLDDFGTYAADLRDGRTVVIPDIRLDPRTAPDTDPLDRLRIRSLINVPIVERGRMVAILFVNDDAVRHWTDAETAFVEDVALRMRSAMARLEAEDRQAILHGELAHRLKNNLALVQSIVSQTLRTAPDLASARITLGERIHALGKAHDVLMTGRRDASSLRDIVGSTTSLLSEAARIRIIGPEIDVRSDSALALVLICHELTTNACKYGALSTPDGQVEVRWTVQDDGPTPPQLVFEWIETGGPVVQPPTHEGFGSRLIRAGMSGIDTVTINYPPAGLRCCLSGSLSALQDVPQNAPR